MRMAMQAPLCRAWLAGAGQCALPDRIADDRYHARSIGRPRSPRRLRNLKSADEIVKRDVSGTTDREYR